jgi:hypothetical protein
VQSTQYVRIATNTAHGRFINLVVHDAGNQGVSFWTPAIDAELYGNIIYNNGTHENLDHGVYVHNEVGTKVIADNVFFNNLARGIQVYASPKNPAIRNIRVEGNVSFNNGTISTAVPARQNLIFNAPVLTEGMVGIGNLLYFSGPHGVNLRGSTRRRTINIVLQDNYAAGSVGLVSNRGNRHRIGQYLHRQGGHPGGQRESDQALPVDDNTWVGPPRSWLCGQAVRLGRLAAGGDWASDCVLPDPPGDEVFVRVIVTNRAGLHRDTTGNSPTSPSTCQGCWARATATKCATYRTCLAHRCRTACTRAVRSTWPWTVSIRPHRSGVQLARRRARGRRSTSSSSPRRRGSVPGGPTATMTAREVLGAVSMEVRRVGWLCGLLVSGCGASGAPKGARPPVLVSVLPALATLPVGGTMQLVASRRDAAGSTGSSHLVIWSFADTTVSKVNSDGAVLGVGGGSTTITATIGGERGQAVISVSQEPLTSVLLVGAGDIADCNSDGDEQTAALLDSLAGTVFTAGDNAYSDGAASDLARCYDASWGRHKARTRPAPGNHDYRSSRARPC